MVSDTTGLSAFIADMFARERAGAAELPERWRRLVERQLRLHETQLAEHVPDPHWTLDGEPLCMGCIADAVWPCDFALSTAAIWREEPGYRQEWGDALDPLAGRT
jgi:hypothetical protein